MTKKTKVILVISVTILLVLILYAVSILILGYLLSYGFRMEPYVESDPASILDTIEDSSVVRFPENIESLKAADRTSYGIDYSTYVFILRFKTDQEGLDQLRKSLFKLYNYSEWKVDFDQIPEGLATYLLGYKHGKKGTPQWYRELPEGVVWTADGRGITDRYDEKNGKGKLHDIRCAWVILTGSEEIIVYMEGEGDYSLKDYGK